MITQLTVALDLKIAENSCLTGSIKMLIVLFLKSLKSRTTLGSFLGVKPATIIFPVGVFSNDARLRQPRERTNRPFEDISLNVNHRNWSVCFIAT